MEPHLFDPNTIKCLYVPTGTKIVYPKTDTLVVVTYPGWDVDLSGNGKLFVEPPSNAPGAAVQMSGVVVGGPMNISNVSTGSPSDRIPVIIVPESHKELISVRYS